MESSDNKIKKEALENFSENGGDELFTIPEVENTKSSDDPKLEEFGKENDSEKISRSYSLNDDTYQSQKELEIDKETSKNIEGNDDDFLKEDPLKSEIILNEGSSPNSININFFDQKSINSVYNEMHEENYQPENDDDFLTTD